MMMASPGPVGGVSPRLSDAAKVRSPLRVEVAAIELELHRPLVTAARSYARRATWLVRVTDADGMIGLGEAAPLPGHGGEAPEMVEPALAALSRALAGRDNDLDQDHDHVARLNRDDVMAISAAIRPVALEAPCARAGMELALCDLAARRAGLTLVDWLGAEADGDRDLGGDRDARGYPDALGDRDTGGDSNTRGHRDLRGDRSARADHSVHAIAHALVPLNATIGAERPERAAERAIAAVAAGYHALKVKVGTGDDEDVARIAAVRAAVGDDTLIRADANGAWDCARAEAMCRALAPFDLEYLEQPVAASDVEGLAALRSAALVPIAADEALLLPDGAAAVIERSAADVWVLKPSLLGGPLQALSVAARARRSGATVVVTSALDSAIGRAGAAHVAAALLRLGDVHACGLATGAMFVRDAAIGHAIESGRLVIPEAPGLGIGDIDQNMVRWKAATQWVEGE